MTDYIPRVPGLTRPCGIRLALDPSNLIDDDTGEYAGAIWQKECVCGRSYTLEVAEDPEYPAP